MRSRKGEIGLGRQPSVVSVQSHPRLPVSRRYGSPLRVFERAIDIGLPIALFHHSVSPNSHNEDNAARGLGQELNGQSSEDQSKELKEHTMIASCMAKVLGPWRRT